MQCDGVDGEIGVGDERGSEVSRSKDRGAGWMGMSWRQGVGRWGGVCVGSDGKMGLARWGAITVGDERAGVGSSWSLAVGRRRVRGVAASGRGV